MLSGEQAGALFAPLADAAGVLVAVSGGPDSIALLALAARWRDTNPAAPALACASVDHGLRPDSRSEAELAAGVAARLGVPHAILRWEGEKPRAGLQEAAREARYGLLAQEARRRGADCIATAHHADDQAETILMRLLRGSGIGGLAGMRPKSARDGVALFRPLLGLRKADLVDFCVREGLPFATDPSNADPRFARTRLRRLAAALEGEGLGPEQWARLARRAARAQDALLAQAQALAASAILQREQGRAIVCMATLAAAPEEASMRLIGAEAERLGGAGPARLERAEAALSRLKRAHAAGEAVATTLAGAVIRLNKSGKLTFEAAPPRRRGASLRPQRPAAQPCREKGRLRHDVPRGASLGKGASDA